MPATATEHGAGTISGAPATTGGYVSQTGLAVVHRGETWSGVGPAARVGELPPLEVHVYIDGDEVTTAVVKTSTRRLKIANGVMQAEAAAGARA